MNLSHREIETLRSFLAGSLLALCLVGCGSPSTESPSTSDPNPTPAATLDPAETGLGANGFNSVAPAAPTVTDQGGTGNVTTYGNVTSPEPSDGGACNYGTTQILYFAAIQVNQEPGDGKGQWQGGTLCGQCARVTVETSAGVRSTVVRIVDKCPDAHCGIDLGGAPARTLMGSDPGRFAGHWEFISCTGQTGVSDGPPSLFVKDGSNPWWALIQARNIPGAVKSLVFKADGKEIPADWASEAENFFTVPAAIRSTESPVVVQLTFSDGSVLSATVSGKALTTPGTAAELRP